MPISFPSEPIHAKKRKNESVIDKYEKMPRRLQSEPEKELIHLLPIKDKHGIIPQTIEKPGQIHLGLPRKPSVTKCGILGCVFFLKGMLFLSVINAEEETEEKEEVVEEKEVTEGNYCLENNNLNS